MKDHTHARRSYTLPHTTTEDGVARHSGRAAARDESLRGSPHSTR